MILDTLIKKLQEQAAEHGGDTRVFIRYPYRDDIGDTRESYEDIDTVEFYPKPPSLDAWMSFTGEAVIIDVD